MRPHRFTTEFSTLYDLAVQLAATAEADALLLLLDAPTDWEELVRHAGGQKVLVAVDEAPRAEGAAEAGLPVIVLDGEDQGIQERLQQALLEAVADDILPSRARVVAVYSSFEAGSIDSISVIDLGEHLGRLTSADLRQIETRVPLDTLRLVVDLALDIGREGREGKPIGTLLVVGDARKVMAKSHPTGFDPVRGYNRKERSLNDPRVREGIKEIAQMDGAIIISADGVVEGAARYIDAPASGITLSKGLGARHWAAAAISRATSAVAVAVSESTGTVRIFRNGEVILRIEPFRRPMKWRDFVYEPPAE